MAGREETGCRLHQSEAQTLRAAECGNTQAALKPRQAVCSGHYVGLSTSHGPDWHPGFSIGFQAI
jgi:hypothetical protein